MLNIKIICGLFLVILSGCAQQSTLQEHGNTHASTMCENSERLVQMKRYSKKAEIHGMTFVSYPKDIPSNFTGCQEVWLGNTKKLATRHFSMGTLTWVKGKEPKDARGFFCFYQNGILDKHKSVNLKRCTRLSKDM